MKTGIIVYVVGCENAGKDFDEKNAIKGLEIKAESIKLVFSGDTCFDVMDAWWNLTREGMSRVVCMIGESVGSSVIRLTGRELQLCGY